MVFMHSLCPSETKNTNFSQLLKLETLDLNMDTMQKIMDTPNSLITESKESTCSWSMQKSQKMVPIPEEAIKEYHMQPC